MEKLYTMHVNFGSSKEYYRCEVLGDNEAEAIRNTMNYFITRMALIPPVESITVVRSKVWNECGVLKAELKTVTL